MPGSEVRRCLSRLLNVCEHDLRCFRWSTEEVVAKNHGSKFRYLRKSEPC